MYIITLVAIYIYVFFERILYFFIFFSVLKKENENKIFVSLLLLVTILFHP